MTTVVESFTVPCRSDVLRMWEALTDTERLNRALGMSRIEVRPLDGAGAARHLVATRLGGLPVEYEERPFEWIYPRSFRILRRMRRGPLRELSLAYTLSPASNGGTSVAVRLELVPRYAALGPFLRFNARLTRRSFEETIREMDAAASSEGLVAPARRSAVAADAFEHAASALHRNAGVPGALVERLTAFVRDGADLDVSRIRPFELADEWHEDRRAVLAACLGAVRAGLLDLRWEIVCPSCRTATDILPSLSSLSEHGACHLCDLGFAVDLDDAVEVTFAPAAAVRRVDVGPYCIGGPARTPHVVAQAILPPSGEALLPAPAEEGRYRLFVRGGAAAPVEVKAGAPAEARFDAWGSAGASPASPQTPVDGAAGATLSVAPSGSVVVTNPAADERHVKLERLGWSDLAARARVVMSLPAFRKDFSADVLRPGMALKVARVTLFFSDLTGSTHLYATTGDAAAFKVVQDHFDVLLALVEEHKGTLVKTIGDAVMAVFTDDLDGLLCSVAILHAFEDFRGAHEDRRRTHVKLGVFGGPCYVVTANGVLDYFGHTVNVAARLQGEARSGELVVEEALADRAVAQKMLPEGFVVERYDAKLKGVEAPVRVARIRLPPA